MVVNVAFIRENHHTSTKLRWVDNNKVTNYNGFAAAAARKISDVCENHAVTAEIFSQ
jgi:hypothetical protein